MKASTDQRIFGLLAAAALLSAAYFVLSYVGEIAFLFFLGIVLAYLLNPLIVKLEARGYRRDRLVTGLYLSVLFLLASAAWLLVPLAMSFFLKQKAQLGDFTGLLRSVPEGIQHDLVPKLPFGNSEAEAALRAAQKWVERSLEMLPSALLAFSPKLANLIVLPFVSFFAMVEGPKWVNKLIRICPNRHVEKVVSLVYSIDDVLGNYIRGLMLDSLIFGTITWISLAVLRLNYAFEIAIIAGLLNIVPYLGPISVALLASMLAFVQFHSTAIMLKVLLTLMAIKFLDDWVFQPTIMSSKVHLHPLLLLFAVMTGGDLFGVFGLIFAVPVAVSIQAAVQVFYDWYLAESGQQKTHYSAHASVIPIV